MVPDRDGVGRGREWGVFSGEVAGEGAVVDEGGGCGGAAVDEVVVEGGEEVGEDGDCEEGEEEEGEKEGFACELHG